MFTLVAHGVAVVRVEMSVKGSFVSAADVVTYDVAGIIIYVRDVADITASEVAVGVTVVIKRVVHDPYMYAIEVVTVGVALVGVCVRSSSDGSADVTVNVAIVGVLVSISLCVTYVADRVAKIIVYMLGLALQSADVALGVAVVIEAVCDFALQSADVALGVAGIGIFVSSGSRVITCVALGVAIIIVGVETFPRSDKGDSLGGRVSIKVPRASAGKSPSAESVALLYGSLRLTYERADVHSDMAEVRAVICVKGYGHFIAFRRATDGDRTHDGYQGE